MTRYTPLVLAALVAAGVTPARAEPPKRIDRKLADEDKDVAALIKAKGWEFRKTFNLHARGELVQLTIENKEKPFEQVKPSAEEWKTLAKSKTVQFLFMLHVDVDDDALQSIAAMESLEVLLVSSKFVTDAGMKHLARHPRLWVLTLSADGVTDAGLAALAAAPSLQRLNIVGGKQTGTGLAAFSASKSLEQLNISIADEFNDDGAKAVAGLTRLRELQLGRGKMTAAGLRAIVEKHVPQQFSFDRRLIDDDLLALLVAKGWLYRPAKQQVSWVLTLPVEAEQLTSLSLEGSAVTDAGLKAVANCPNITYLNLSKTRITDAGLTAALKAHPKLQKVRFAETKVTGVGVQAVAAAAGVTALDASGCALDEAAFQAIGGMKKLAELSLKGVKFKPEWLKGAGGPALKSLDVEDTAFDDAVAAALAAQAPNLETLTANKTALGDAGLKALAGLAKLRTLYNYGTPATKSGVAEFKKAKPRCFVPFDGRD